MSRDRAHADASPVAPRRALVPLVGAWLVVLMPALWGIAQVVQKSMALFR